MSRFASRAKELLTAAKKGDPIPRLDRSVQAESLWPASLETEADKAATILRSFFADGFIVPYRTLAVCDHQVFRRCRGIAVFHLLRNDLRSPKASGSGVLIARLPGGGWSGPSAISIDNDSTFPSTDIDALDVLLVINDKQGMDALLEPVVALNKNLAVTAGPIPRTGALQTSSSSKPFDQASVWSYAKSQGELVEMDLSGLTIREASDENERFYGTKGVSGREILSVKAKTPSDNLSRALQVLDQGSGDLSSMPKSRKCPGDRRLKAPAGST